jgi:hypothetical protein
MKEYQRPHTPRSSVRRPVIAAAALLVAIALTLVVVRSWLDREAPDLPVESIASPSPGIATDPVQEAVAEPSVVASPPAPVPSMTVTPAGPIRIVVLPARIRHPTPETQKLVEAVRQAMRLELQRTPNVVVIEVSDAEVTAVIPSEAGDIVDTRPAYLSVGRRYGGEHVVAISESTRPEEFWWSIRLQVHSAVDSGGNQMSIPRDRDLAAVGPVHAESIGRMFALTVLRQATQQLSQDDPVDVARAAFLDTSRPDAERLESLSKLRASGLDSQTVAAAAELGTRSASADTRRAVWSTLRMDVYDAALALPLGYALLSDPDASVRKEAALALATYLGEANTRSTLESARRNDTSAEVRLAARLSMMNYEEQQVLAQATLLDRRLTPAERLAPTMLNHESIMPRLSGSPAEAQEMARAYAEVVAGTDDVGLKLRSLSELNMVARFAVVRLEPAIVEVLIDSVDVANESVHRIALDLLRREVANPDVRAVLEAVVEDEPELAGELRIPEVLEWRSPGEPEWLRK